MPESRPPFPPFDLASALQEGAGRRGRLEHPRPAEGGPAYTPDSVWRNRDTHIVGRERIIEFLARKWERELDYALRKGLWSFFGNRIAVRFQYESHDAEGQWWRSYGNELWEFDENGLMSRREASINDRRITAAERRIFGPRPESEHGQDFPLW